MLECLVKMNNLGFFRLLLGRGGWKNKNAQPQKQKMNLNIIRQEQLIAEKKKEIEAKLAEQAKINAQPPNECLPAR